MKSQYIELFRDKSKIKNSSKIDMDTEYPLLLDFTKKILGKLKDKYPQYNICGDQNLWIVKPGHSSRGRGIVVLTNYYKILAHIRESRGRNWVIQKYIENPLIINKRKFDIRQWVLVTDWNPLTVWIYSECYIRFALMDYDPKNKIQFAHLTNNCLVKKYNNSAVKERIEREK